MEGKKVGNIKRERNEWEKRKEGGESLSSVVGSVRYIQICLQLVSFMSVWVSFTNNSRKAKEGVCGAVTHSKKGPWHVPA